ncbi:hypothetical protein JK386_12985 [Nocardioides sp. zg-536]|uniref:CHAP domain-containing protein n=1 Tax=Nocardioides faecalis TaxID=2803858 RepID=A0A938Y676_9ACTN|nr:hypothetical protein [Nocardioides faecalis]MBM9460818.1 hypothetical protein [Nocardioides faecalis]QVI58006.1 hypothetical protein KG111_13360 [Nocardioides faecalis]
MPSTSWPRLVPRLALTLATTGLVLAVAAALLPPPPASAARATALKLSSTAADFRSGEEVFLRVEARRGGRAIAKVKIRVLSRTGNGSWREVARKTTGSGGTVVVSDRPSRTTTYRAVTVERKVGSRSIKVARTTRARTLAQRQEALAQVTGRARGAAVTTRRLGSQVVYQRHARAVVAQVGSSTWLVRGRMLKAYLRKGGVEGRLGAPVVDMRCGLLEGACVQRFQNGAIYLNNKARKKVAVAYGRTKATPILAAALSQRGYREPTYRGSKYGKWVGSKQPWCGIFLAWASHASGSGDAIPRAKSFPAMISKVRARGQVRSAPKVGRIAFIGSTPHHAVLILAVRQNTIVTLEGNVGTRGGAGHPRGVRKLVRPLSSVKFYAEPRL